MKLSIVILLGTSALTGACYDDIEPGGSIDAAADDGAGPDLAGDTAAGTPDVLAEDSAAPDSAADTAVAPDTSEDTAADTAVVADTAVAPDTSEDTTPDADVPSVEELPQWSFFVTSLEAMRRLSGVDEGFGGDLRFGEETGLAGADKICATIAEEEMPGAGAKRWHAFLSATDDGAGNVVNAIERIGEGPWYDRNGRLVANDKQGLTSTRPDGVASVKNDLPNERGESQKQQPGAGAQGTADNHDVLTGSNSDGELDSNSLTATCQNWTSSGDGRPRLGHSWPAMSGQGWIEAHPAAGCQALVNITQNGPGDRDCEGVGCGGGYGALYCFAEIP